MTDTQLHDAVEMGNVTEVKRLLEMGADVAAFDEYNFTPLHSACSVKFSEPIFELLLKYGVDVNQKTKYGRITPLSLALFSSPEQHAAVVLLERGCEIDSARTDNPLWHAISRKSFEQASIALINRLKNVNQTDDKGMTILEYAIQYAPTTVVCALLDRGVHLNPDDSREKRTPLRLAMRLNRLDVTRALLTSGADPNGRVSDGYSERPLFQAIANGRIDYVLALLEAGADPNFPLEITSPEKYPINYAVMINRLDITKALVKYNAKIELPFVEDCGQKVTPLFLALEMHKDETIARFLIEECGANPLICNKHGLNALEYAIVLKRDGIIKLLMERNVPITHNFVQYALDVHLAHDSKESVYDASDE